MYDIIKPVKDLTAVARDDGESNFKGYVDSNSDSDSNEERYDSEQDREYLSREWYASG